MFAAARYSVSRIPMRAPPARAPVVKTQLNVLSQIARENPVTTGLVIGVSASFLSAAGVVCVLNNVSDQFLEINAEAIRAVTPTISRSAQYNKAV